MPSLQNMTCSSPGQRSPDFGGRGSTVASQKTKLSKVEELELNYLKLLRYPNLSWLVVQVTQVQEDLSFQSYVAMLFNPHPKLAKITKKIGVLDGKECSSIIGFPMLKFNEVLYYQIKILVFKSVNDVYLRFMTLRSFKYCISVKNTFKEGSSKQHLFILAILPVLCSNYLCTNEVTKCA